MIGLYRCKDEARWIERSLLRTLEVADHVVFMDDHSTDATAEIVQDLSAAGQPIAYLASPFEGLQESRDKQWLLQRARERFPDERWFLAVDGDEVLDRKAPKVIPELVKNMETAKLNVAWFQFLFLWDTEKRARWDGIYGATWQKRLWKIEPETPSAFPAGDAGVGFHCGWAPIMEQREVHCQEVKFLHFGNLHRADRERKQKFYQGLDPNNSREDGYQHLLEENAGKGHYCRGPFQTIEIGDLF